LRFTPRITRDKTNANNPTLTSNGTTLGWGTLEILPGNQGFGSLNPLGRDTRLKEAFEPAVPQTRKTRYAD